MKIAIIGAGAMGCLYACLLSKNNEVSLFDVNSETVERINCDGIKMQSPDGDEKVFGIKAEKSGSVSCPYELVILFVKDTVSEIALKQNTNLIGKESILLSLQNGMGNYEIMERFTDRDRILLGTTKHNCVTVAPGTIYHSGAGVTHIGSPSGNEKAAEKICSTFSDCGIDTAVCPDVKHLLWEKLFINMTINSVTALLDCKISVMAETPFAESLIRSIVSEAVAVAGCDGEKFDSGEVTSDVINTSKILGTGKASMCQDIEHKRRTEIDFINGAVVSLGKKYGIPTPVNSAIVNLIHLKESTYNI